MSERKLATVENIIDIQPILDADKIVKAKVRNWWVVVGKDQFNIGDRCLYFEIDSLLPINNPLFDSSLGKYNATKTMVTDEGKEITGYRIKTVKLRGQISQGLILPYDGDKKHGTDMTEELGIVKYDPYVYVKGAQLQSDNGAEGLFPSFIPKTDEERIQNLEYSDIDGYVFQVSEKLDGTSFTAYKYEDQFKVCSRNLILREDENSVYWKIAKKYNLKDIVPEGFAIQGEIVGPGIQGNPLKLKEIELYLFNMYDINKGEYLEIFKLRELPQVPYINEIGSRLVENTSIEEMINSVNGMKSLINPLVQTEGLVYKRFHNSNKISFKIINNKYLLKEK